MTRTCSQCLSYRSYTIRMCSMLELQTIAHLHMCWARELYTMDELAHELSGACNVPVSRGLPVPLYSTQLTRYP